MPRNFHADFKLKVFVIFFLTQILSLGFLINQVKAEWASHLVISAVQITEQDAPGDGKAGHDFIEIYNPTSNDINLNGYRLVKRTKSGVSDTSIKSWTGDIIIKAHGWRLWASSDDEAYPLGIRADDVTKQTIASDNGVAIRFGALDTGEIIDSAAWGEAENIFKEGGAAPVLGIRESIVRNPGVSGGGNGEDTNNNGSDFVIKAGFSPHNSQNASEPFIENVSAPDTTPLPSVGPDSVSGSNSGTPIVKKVFPVAEAGFDKEAVIGENIDFDGSDSFDPRGKELKLNWDFGDKTTAKGINVSHSYSAIGEYIVILKADNGENISDDSLKVKIVAPEFSNKVILSEIFPNPIGADKDGEWVELYNSGDVKVNLGGWILASNAKTGGKQYVFSKDDFIEAKSYLVVKRNESGLVLTNETGSVSLIWPADKILSEITYSAAKEGKSYAFLSNSWEWVDAPTPGKENLIKVLENILEEDDNIVSLADTAKDTKKPEVSGNEKESINKTAMKTTSAKNEASSAVKNIDIENYLNKLISEKVNIAIFKAKASEITPQKEEKPAKKTVSPEDNAQEKKCTEEDKESSCREFCLAEEKNSENNRKDVRNNPWFYGDMILSALSLFLVWRYQEVRKRLKN